MEALISFALLRSVAYGAIFGVVVAILKGLIHAAYPDWARSGPVGSMINNTLLRILGIAREAGRA